MAKPGTAAEEAAEEPSDKAGAPGWGAEEEAGEEEAAASLATAVSCDPSSDCLCMCTRARVSIFVYAPKSKSCVQWGGRGAGGGDRVDNAAKKGASMWGT